MNPPSSLSSLRSKAMLLAPSVRIGKNGLTPGVVQEISVLLDKRKLVKVKMLRSSLEAAEKQKIIDAILKETGAILVQAVGLVFTLYREKPRTTANAG